MAIRATNVPLYTGLNDCGIPSDAKRKFKCDCCGETVEVPVTYIHIKSDFDKSEFCSYNCRCKYYKEHANERYEVLHPDITSNARRFNEMRKKRYREDPEVREKIKQRALEWAKNNRGVRNGLERKKRTE